MRSTSSLYNQDPLESLITSTEKLRQATRQVCERALPEAKSHLHLLLHQADLERLDQRPEFIQAFKNALEQQITEQIILRLPNVKAVYRFDSIYGSNKAGWDNTIHLLILVPQLTPSIQKLGPKLDPEIRQQLGTLNWSRFQLTTSVVEIQQVTPSEIRHGTSYGAMFSSYYAGPAQIWPSVQPAIPCFAIKKPSSEAKTGLGGKAASAGVKR